MIADSAIPTWLAIAASAAAVVTALGIMLNRARKWMKSMITFVAAVNEMVPMVRSLTATFRDSPRAFGVLDDIAREFAPDSGTSLRDVVNRLEGAAAASKTAADQLKVGVETSRQLAERDREDYRDILLRLDRVTVQLHEGLVEGAASRKKMSGEAAAVERRQIKREGGQPAEEPKP